MSGPIVIKIGGSLLESMERKTALWREISHANACGAAESGLIICHGGGGAVDKHLKAQGLTSEKRDGIRVTPKEHLETVTGVLAGVVNTQLVASLRANGVPAVGLTLADAGTVVMTTDNRHGTDLGCVGRVVSHDGSVFHALLSAGFVPVVASIGVDDQGQILNVNADDAAEGVAASVNAESLLLLTDVPGVLDANGQLLSRLGVDEIPGLVSSGVVVGGMAAKVNAAAACAQRLERAVIIAHERDVGAILDGDQSVGTRVSDSRVRTQPIGVQPIGE